MQFTQSHATQPSAVASLLETIPLPWVIPVSQVYDRPRIDGMEAAVTRCLRENGCLKRLRKGWSVAITAGSRGITDLPIALRTLVRAVKDAGGEPFVVPAMGSHGGATAEGQAALLKGLGIDETTVEAPIRSSMETVVVGVSSNGLPAYMDALAAKADAIIPINRVKPHTSFRGPIESGVVKMLTIGLGKQKGAAMCHNLGFRHMAVNVPAIAEAILANKNILCAITIVENAFHETAFVEALRPEEMIAREKDILREASRLAPRIFFDSLDIVIIDEIGKDISGTGFDCNVVGRYHNDAISGGPTITRMAALDITDKSKGNGNGIGIMDFTTRRAFAKFDPEQTYPNSLTSTVPLAVKMPMVLANDRQAIQAAIKTCNVERLETVRLVRIKNTNEMTSIYVSESLAGYCREHPNLRVEGEAAPFLFNAEGNLW